MYNRNGEEGKEGRQRRKKEILPRSYDKNMRLSGIV
jgi:hypothetical protein